MTDTTIDKMDQPLPLWLLLLLPLWAAFFMALVVFPAAGDWRWINGWILVLSFAINLGISYAIINQKNPRVIRNRTKMRKSGLTAVTREAAASDRFILPLASIGFLGVLLVPGLGHRFGWYELPFAVAPIGVVIANAGMTLGLMAQLENSYASMILDINQGQKLVDSGLYAQARHPMYAGGIIMILGAPIALGSLWGVIPALLGSLMLVIRIKFEEQMLLKGMAGYDDYRSRVKYKLIPGIF